jgi:putative drug exporter of the RND superfamily
MASMIVSDLRVIGELGTTIGLGLLVDTLIVRSFMTPSIAAALGHWFWWPINTIRVTRKAPNTDDALTARIPVSATV